MKDIVWMFDDYNILKNKISVTYYRKSIRLLQTYFKLLELDDHIQTVVGDIGKYWMYIEYDAGGQCAIDLSKVKLDKTSLGKICVSMHYNKTACIRMNLKYCSLDGSCNNLKCSSSGKAYTAYKRLLFNSYIDSFNEVFEDSFSSYKPSPIRLSVEFIKDEHLPNDFKMMTMAYWTIFGGYDLSHTGICRMRGQENCYGIHSAHHLRCSEKTIPGGTGLNCRQKATVTRTTRPPTLASATALVSQYYRLLIP